MMGEMVDTDALVGSQVEEQPSQGGGMIVNVVGDDDDSRLAMPDGVIANRIYQGKTGWAVPLWLMRRTACLNVLRRQGVRSCVEFGCGSGSVLSVCTAPAWSADDFPALYPPSPVVEDTDDDDNDGRARRREQKLQVLRNVPRVDPEKNELHLRRLVGVDVRPESLKQAIELTAPPPASHAEYDDDPIVSRERWEELIVELWEGGIETYNESFDGVDGIIVTEVIEHLSPKALEKAEQILLSVYAPRVMIVTTPNYSFNPWFPSSSTTSTSSNGNGDDYRVPDPTGRTTRRFRDADHQFEFTEHEFRKWATQLARENDYKVSFSGVGSLAEFYAPDECPASPPSAHHHPEAASSSRPSDPWQFFATQIAVFERQLSYEAERSPRSHRMQPLPFMTRASTTADSPYKSPSSSVRPSISTNDQPAGNDPSLRPSPPFRRQSLYPLPHILRKTHVHRAHRSTIEYASSPDPESILSLCESYLFHTARKDRATLGELWAVSQIRRACGGQTSALVEAALDSDAWSFELVQGQKGMDALMIIIMTLPSSS